MSNSKLDGNRKSTLIGVSSADGATPINVKVDPDTQRMYVDVALSSLTDLTGVTDGELVNAADKGILALGTDGSNYQVLATDSSGNLQVEVLTMPTTTVQATNLDIRDLTSVSDSVEVKQATGTNLHVVVDTAPTTAVTNAGITTIAGAVTGTEMQVDVLTMPTVAVTGTFYQATQPVSLATVPSHAVTNAGTFVIQENGASLTALQVIDNFISGSRGLVTEDNSGSIKTSVELLDNSVDGNYLNVNMNIAGVDVSATVPVPVRPNEFELAGITTHVKKYYTYAGAVTDGIIWSPAAGKRWYITDIFIQVSAASTVTLEDDLAGGDSAIWKAELAANSGWSHSFNTPWFSGEDAADLIITTSAGNIYCMVVGYEI